MALTARADTMLATLPSYFHGEPLIERILQAWANEIDRIDALLGQIATELQPGAATDDLGLLGAWEKQLGLPVMPPDATENQRRAKLTASLRKLDSGASADAMATIQAAMGAGVFTVYREEPDPLTDTLEIPYDAGTYNAALIEAIALRIWPAHRRLYMRYADGFLLDLSRLDEDTL